MSDRSQEKLPNEEFFDGIDRLERLLVMSPATQPELCACGGEIKFSHKTKQERCSRGDNCEWEMGLIR